MVIALVASRPMKSHPVWVNSVGNVATEPAVVGCEGRVVQPPILEVVVGGVHIPPEVVGGLEKGR